MSILLGVGKLPCVSVSLKNIGVSHTVHLLRVVVKPTLFPPLLSIRLLCANKSSKDDLRAGFGKTWRIHIPYLFFMRRGVDFAIVRHVRP